MGGIPTLPENYKIVQLAQPQTTDGGFTSDWLDLKNALRATIVVELTQAVGHATAFTLNRATDTTPTGNTTLANNVPVWANEDTGASDTLVKQTNAKAHTVSNDIKNKQIVFQVDPADLGDTYDAVAVVVADSSQATNLVTITAIVETRYKQATPPSAL